MYLSIHTAAGLALARLIPNPIVAFIAGLLSHFVLDFIPHGDEFLVDASFTRRRIRRRLLGAAILDGIILLCFLLLYIWITPNLYMPTVLASVAGCLLPDMLQGIYLVTEAKWLKPFSKIHDHLHNLPGHHLEWQKGVIVQALSFTALWLLLL